MYILTHIQRYTRKTVKEKKKKKFEKQSHISVLIDTRSANIDLSYDESPCSLKYFSILAN